MCFHMKHYFIMNTKFRSYTLKSDWNYVLIRIWEFKSVNPKISRIGRQKRNKEFFSYLTNRPIWLPTVRNDIKRFDFLFFSSKFAKLENSAKGPSAAAIRLEIWHMFNMLVWTYQTLSQLVLYTVCGASLKLYFGLNFV